jgi:hypothetical protein
MEDVQQPTPTPDRDEASLSMSEAPDTLRQGDVMSLTQQDVSVPVAEMEPTPPSPDFVPFAEQMLTPPSPVSAPAKVEAAEEEVISPFMQKLRDLENKAKIEMMEWDPMYLGQAVEEGTGSTAPNAKRKGTMSSSNKHI